MPIKQMSGRSTLLNYIKKHIQDISTDQLLRNDELDFNNDRFISFLNETMIMEEEDNNTKMSKRLLSAHLHSLTYLEFIDALMMDLLLTSSRLLNGFANLPVDSLGLDVTIGFQSNQLKGPMWARVCHRIGRENFAILISKVGGIFQPEAPLINLKWGYRIKRFSSRNPNLIDRSHMYYNNRSVAYDYKVLSSSTESILSEIIGLKVTTGRPAKKFRKLFHLIEDAKHREFSLNYYQLQRSLLSERISRPGVFENSTPTKEVIRLVLVMLLRLFPANSLGSPGNRAKISDSVVEFLTMSRHEKLNLDSLVFSLKITEIPWLGKTRLITSIQDFNLRTLLLRKFLFYLFAVLIVNFVKSFWYLTESPAAMGGANIYFSKKKWKSITKQWLNHYVSRYLCRVDSSIPEKDLRLGQLANLGMLRLLPKKSDLRPLCVPCKQAFDKQPGELVSKSKFEGPRSSHDSVRPIRDILRYQQVQYHLKFPKTSLGCYSMRDVSLKIVEFRKNILNMSTSNTPMPRIHGVQFDMKNCYENLSQAKIIACIEQIFSTDEKDEEYFLRNVVSLSSDLRSYRKNFNIVSARQNVEELNAFHNSSLSHRKEIISDNYKLVKYTKNDVIDLVRSQVIDSTAFIPGYDRQYYKRTRGVFQGFPLLATLCDIVYNSLVDTVILRNFKGCSAEESVFLRWADDFIFLSTSRDLCDTVYRNANSHEAQAFGAFVNEDKLRYFDSSDPSLSVASFVGLQINIRTLTIEKQAQKIRLPKFCQKSMDASFLYLQRYLTQCLQDYLINLDLIPIDAVLANLSNIFNPIHYAIIKIAKQFKDIPDLEDIIRVKFSLILAGAVMKWRAINGDNHKDSFCDFMENLLARVSEVVARLSL